MPVLSAVITLQHVRMLRTLESDESSTNGNLLVEEWAMDNDNDIHGGQ